MIGICLEKEALMLQKCHNILLGIGLGLVLLGCRTEVMDCYLLSCSKLTPEMTLTLGRREIRVGGRE